MSCCAILWASVTNRNLTGRSCTRLHQNVSSSIIC